MIDVETNPPVLNLPLLLDLIAWAERDEEAQKRLQLKGKWNQGVWGELDGKAKVHPDGTYIPRHVCGTSHCMAGGAVIAAGYRMVFADHDLFREGKIKGDFDAEGCIRTEPTGLTDKKGRMLYRDVPGEESQDISLTAQEILGLEEDEADRLFNGGNSIKDLKCYVNGLCERRGLSVPYSDVDAYEFL